MSCELRTMMYLRRYVHKFIYKYIYIIYYIYVNIYLYMYNIICESHIKLHVGQVCIVFLHTVHVTVRLTFERKKLKNISKKKLFRF